MKKKIVYFLCRIGLYRLAYKISPHYTTMWNGEKIRQGFIDGMRAVGQGAKYATIELDKFTVACRKYLKGKENGNI